MFDWLIGIGIAIVVGLVLGYLLWRLYDRVDDWIDEKQRAVNKLENQFAKAGSTWMSDLLEDLVVGDEETVVTKVTQLMEAPDTSLFFLDNVALPCAEYAIREAGAKYPERLAKLEAAWPREEDA